MHSLTQRILLIVLGISIGAGATYWWAQRPAHVHEHAESERQDTLYTCSMHPHIIRHEPGQCPICNMALTPIANPDAVPPSRADGEREILYWRAPMDPSYTSDEPGKSPMGMDLVPVYADEFPGGGEARNRNIVRVDPSFLQNFGVRTAVVERGSIPLEVRTVGILSHDEEQVHAVTTKYEGWIETASHNTIGEHIHQGTPLFEIYSPALVTTQKEFLAAAEYVQRLEKSSAYPEAVERARSLLESARERLRYWDLTAPQIDGIMQRGEPQRTVTIFAPVSGHLMTKSAPALEGMRVSPGMTILTIANHTKLWAKVALYENDIQHVREGMAVRVEVDAYPGRTWRGTVGMFGPELDGKTRTLTAFVQIPNTDLKLRPGMYAQILIRPPGVSNAVKVPEQAILHSGERSVVIVQVGPGRFEPRKVELGPIGGGFQEVRRGVEAGETVVTSSQFLIDSESNLKSAIRQLLGEPSEAVEKPTPMEHQH